MLDFINKPINPPGPYRFTVISTFAGCGGSSLGYKWAGGKVLAAVEWDASAVETYRLNHHGTLILHRDIATVTGAELLQATGLSVGELDIFDGSPPCQGFSTAGKRDFTDERNDLFKHYARLVTEVQPRVFVMENVSGMVKGVMKHKFAEIMQTLKACGYRVRCQVLDAQYFGVPQHRERTVFIGVREDVGIEPSHPKAQARPIALRTAIGSLNAPIEIETDISRYAIGSEWRRLAPGQKSSKYISLTRPGWDRPCPTITKMAGSLSAASVTHPSECRKFSRAEAATIASFPAGFQWAGSYTQAIERIGNTVPPRFMQAIAEHVYENILTKIPEREGV